MTPETIAVLVIIVGIVQLFSIHQLSKHIDNHMDALRKDIAKNRGH